MFMDSQTLMLISECKELRIEVAELKKRLKLLEESQSYVGKRLKDFYCNGYFGRYYDLEDAEVILDDGLYIEVRTTDRKVRSTEFDNVNQKIDFLRAWMNPKDE